jgi:hypothetical protein
MYSPYCMSKAYGAIMSVYTFPNKLWIKWQIFTNLYEHHATTGIHYNIPDFLIFCHQ